VEAGKCKCGAVSEVHPCPYYEDVHSDPNHLFSCCEECTEKCAEDI
jgi:hypothetical protein